MALGLTGTPRSEPYFAPKVPPSIDKVVAQFSALGLQGLGGNQNTFAAKAPDTTGRGAALGAGVLSANPTQPISRNFDVSYNVDFNAASASVFTTGGNLLGQGYLSGNAVMSSGPNVSGRLEGAGILSADPTVTNRGTGNALGVGVMSGQPIVSAIASGSAIGEGVASAEAFIVDFDVDIPINYYVTTTRQANERTHLSFAGQSDDVAFDYRPWADDHGNVFNATWELISGDAQVSNIKTQGNIIMAVVTTPTSGNSIIKITASSTVNVDVQYLNVTTREANTLFDDYGRLN